MSMVQRSGRTPPQSLAEGITRVLRHDTGDLLQTVYASVAILQKRLPLEMELERRVLSDLRSRAEGCKILLDIAHDFACPLTLNYEAVDLAATAAQLASAFASHYPQLEIRNEGAASVRITADPTRLVQVGNSLLELSCERAQHQVRFQTLPVSSAGQAEWIIEDDGAPVPAEERDHVFDPFSADHRRLGLRVALARKLVCLHGGQVALDNSPNGGLQIRVSLPSVPPESAKSAQDVPFFPGVEGPAPLG